MKRTISTAAPAPTSPFALPPPLEPLGPASLPHDTRELARALIGKLLVRRHEGETLIARIVETEAYLPDDRASHAFRGPTARNRAMFGPPLHAYVYFIYGVNWCLNVTSEREGVGAAVLVRACEPVQGLELMRALRGRPGVRDRDVLRGPGNLCRALAVGPELDGAGLLEDGELRLAADGTSLEVGVSRRIGITKAAEAEWRYYARGSTSLSGPRALSP